MLGWDEMLCEDLAARGYYVVRFDNRCVPARLPCLSTPKRSCSTHT